EDVGPHDLNEEGGDAEATTTDKPEGKKKRWRAAGASGFEYPPKKLREDPAPLRCRCSTAGKSLDALQGLLELSTFAMEVGVTATTTVPFVTYSMTLTPERGGGGNTDSISGPNLRTQRPSERFVAVPPPPVMTAAVATTAIAGATSAPVLRADTKLVHRSLFTDYASPNAARTDVAGPSHPTGAEVSTDTFYVSQDMDSKTLQQIYFPKWNVINDSALDNPEFNVGAARQTCLSAEVRLQSEHNLREKKKFKRMCNRQADLLKDKDDDIENLKAQLSLKEAEAAEVIRLYSQVSAVEAAEAARISELDSLKERNLALEGEKTIEGQVAMLDSMAASKDTKLMSMNAQVAKLNHDLSRLQLSFDELSIKALSLESERDGLVDQVSSLEGTCSRLRDQVSGYELFKEHCDAIQDAQVKVLSDHVVELDSVLMGMAIHLDEEFYPRFLTTIAGWRWVIRHGLRLAVMKCLQLAEYVIALGTAIGLVFDKGMQTGLVAGINHGKSRRSFADGAAYDPSMEAKKEDNVVIGETSLSDSLDAVHARVQKIKEGTSSRRLSISDVMGPLVDPLSSKNLVGEASTSGVPTTVAATTALVVANVNSIVPISMTNYRVLDAEP
ncbi:hypothetical protein Tco_1451654, partial [Tanacetum coccineum]